MEDQTLAFFAHIEGLLAGVIARLASPSMAKLFVPLLALALFAAGWQAWQRAATTALGRAARWWIIAVSGAVIAGLATYLLTAPTEDEPVVVAARVAAMENLGSSPFSTPIAAAGGVAVTIAVLIASWFWRESHLPPKERASFRAEWEQHVHPWRRLIAISIAGAASLVAAGLGSAIIIAAFTEPQVPLPPSGHGALWVGTNAGISRLEMLDGRGTWRVIRRASHSLPSNRITSIAFSPMGHVWVGTDRGIGRFERAGREARWTGVEVDGDGLPHFNVLSLGVDGQGSVWAGTAGGAAEIDPSGNGRGFTGKNAPLMHQILDAVHADTAGRVWLGGAGGVNVLQPSRTADALHHEPAWLVGFNRNSTRGALPDDMVYAVYGDSRGRVWFGTAGGAASLLPDPSGHGLGAYNSERWLTITRSNAPLPNERVHAIVEDRQGRLWFGTEGGIAVLDESQAADAPDRWRVFRASDSEAGSGASMTALPNAWVQALSVGPDGRIWAGTRGG
ncbi:MAG TPA: two-component regulator propeller domain-containing protein, partial [Chloroflexota bacterium]|nr:two-component regulator propeller domain-containing protein [Chloroflexota bacterium]